MNPNVLDQFRGGVASGGSHPTVTISFSPCHILSGYIAIDYVQTQVMRLFPLDMVLPLEVLCESHERYTMLSSRRVVTRSKIGILCKERQKTNLPKTCEAVRL